MSRFDHTVPLRWGIIGCGDVCEVKSGPALYKTPNSQLRIVMRRDLELAQDFARRHGVAEATNDARTVIEHPEVDIVYVATPPGTHEQYAVATAAAGKPCYVEKPMARSAAECERMNHAFAIRDLPLFVAYYRRALPRFQRVREVLESGELGILRGVEHVYCGERARGGQPAAGPTVPGWREQAEHSGGGLFLDLGSHVLDLIDYLLGPLSEVAGSAARLTPAGSKGAVEDTIVASFATQSGARGTLRHYFHTGTALDRLTFFGDLGQLSCSVFGAEPIRLQTGGSVREFVVPMPEHVHQPLVASIVAELRGESEARSPSTGESAARTSRVMDQILSGYYGDRSQAFWEHPERWPRGKPA